MVPARPVVTARVFGTFSAEGTIGPIGASFRTRTIGGMEGATTAREAGYPAELELEGFQQSQAARQAARQVPPCPG